MEYQLYLNDGQKNYLLEYMRGERTATIFGMCITLLTSLFIMFFIIIPNHDNIDTWFNSFPFVVFFFAFFMTEFIGKFGKTFCGNCDIYCIENDLYSLNRSELGFNKKHSHDLKYQISDNDGNIYICPKYADYRENKFIYIKLENGRNYAIADN